MTKSDLLRILEPFDDEIEIVVVDREHKYHYVPGVFYELDSGKGTIALSIGKPTKGGKWVELKI